MGDIVVVYSFYCLKCGKENKEDDVLYDMTPMILGLGEHEIDEIRAFSFPIAVNLNQIKQWDNKNIPLSFAELKNLYSSKNNYFENQLNDVCESLPTYWEKITAADFQKLGENDLEISDVPDSIKNLIELGVENDPTGINQHFDDIKKLYAVFSKGKLGKFEIIRDTKNGNLVLGYSMNRKVVQDARICRRCGEKAFKKAGTAEHTIVSFVGRTSSAKTCTIAALMHYIKKGIGAVDDCINPIWRESVDEFKIKFPKCTIEALNLDDQDIKFELIRYENGVEPKKTRVGNEKLYHIVIKIHCNGNTKILSIADLPGELFTNGKVDLELLKSKFSASLSSKALVLCFGNNDDTDLDTAKIMDQIDYAIALQKYCADEHKQKQDYRIPIIFLLTKCDKISDLSSEESSLYMFDGQINRLESQPVFRAFTDKLNEVPNTFYAATPCAAFGAQPHPYIDPDNNSTIDDDVYSEKILREIQNKIDVKPKGIAHILEWILSVSGCVGISAKHVNEKSHVSFEMKNYFLQDVQYRIKNPGESNNYDYNSVLNEVLARHVLFQNPGCHDKNILNSRNDKDDYSGIWGSFQLFVDSLSHENKSCSIEIRKMKKQKDTNS